MSIRFQSGWRTTIEPVELGYPVRYWWTEDNWSDVAWCEAQGSAAAACSALTAARAQPDPDPELTASARERADIDVDELRTLQAASVKRHAAMVELIAYLLDETVALGDMHRFVESVRTTLGERERGIEEFIPAAAAATMSAARDLVQLLSIPYAGGDDDD